MSNRSNVSVSARSSRGASLDTKLVLGCMVLLGLSLALALGLITILGSDYVRASRNLEALTLYRKVLSAANRLSAERGPMNSVLGEEPATDSPAARKLAEFRTLSDQALAEIAPDDGNEITRHLVARDKLGNVQANLVAARRAADRLSARPLAERDTTEIRSVIAGMFGVVETMRPVVLAAMAELMEHDSSLTGHALTGLMLGDLREYAGRLGSFLAPSIAARQPLSATAYDELVLTHGRVLQIWQSLEHQLALHADAPELVAAVDEARTRYFRDGLDLIARLNAEGKTGYYSVTTEQMTSQYVPTMAPLERLRDSFLDDMLAHAQAARASSVHWLQLVAVFTILIVLTNLLLLELARRRIFRPLLQARNHIVALAEERNLDRPTRVSGHGEIHELFAALESLRLKLRERLRLTERLKVQAETDALTGLLNRRTFDRLGRDDSGFVDLPVETGLILMDIDRFKLINDTYGHIAGDHVLRATAGLVVEMVRKNDLVMRYGGEEFAIVLPSTSLRTLARIAETLRAAIAEQAIMLDDGTELLVTASFGVATGRRDGPGWKTLIEAADQALYTAKAEGRNRVGIAGEQMLAGKSQPIVSGRAEAASA